ncbi:macro domain-containing protein [Halosolutus amylolyticus]|uniref:Macro domain-containing protein n=1 Tax=Halosolutus amylolyticus TaxID=2932267 RepID=A0ABD5PSM8_9EURY|nr:macro domain-containing protein [Halosolutus amylolyticus]
MDFTTVQGDIANQEADALVNAAGTSLRMGSGVAGSLRRNANGPINQEAMEKGPVELGDVAVTDAYDLDADYVIHAAAMPHYGDGRATDESIRTATRQSLQKADELSCESIVMPVLGTGAAGFDFRDGAQLVCEAVWNYEPSSVTDARVIAYSQREHDELESIADEIRSTSKES